MLNALLTRWARTRGTLATSFFARSTQAAQAKGDSFWQTILRRGGDPAVPLASPMAAGGALPAARAQFEASLEGLQGDDADTLAQMIGRSRSLDDLWHLRTRLYNEIARQFSQYEAEQRLAALQAHFTVGGRRH